MSSEPRSVSPEEWREAGRFVEWRGQRIFVRVAGSGRPLLLLHGFPTASWDWSAVWPALETRFRLVTLDLLGFGFSSKPLAFAYSIPAQADLVEDVLSREGIESTLVLAHDYGDTVGQELLARRLDGSAKVSFEAFCFLNGGLFPESHRPVLLQKLLASPVGPLLARLTGYERFAANLRVICRKPLTERELAAMWRLTSANDGLKVMSRLIGYMEERRQKRERWVGALRNADVPLRLVDGLDDPVSGAHLAARYRELVPNADVVGLPGVGHYPQLEAPEEVVAAFLQFAGSSPA